MKFSLESLDSRVTRVLLSLLSTLNHLIREASFASDVDVTYEILSPTDNFESRCNSAIPFNHVSNLQCTRRVSRAIELR